MAFLCFDVSFTMRRQDLAGLTFHEWTVLTAAPSSPSGDTAWLCRCSCGKEKAVFTKALQRAMSKSCGCQSGRTFHGGSNTAEYRTWHRIWHRCTNPNNPDWMLYGGRGIRVDRRWAEFPAFLADMGTRPSALHSLDRHPDQDGPYSPENCRWATPKMQARNMRVNRMISHSGETLCLSAWAERTGISRECIEKRIDNLGWSIEDALTRPVRGRRSSG